MKFMLVQTGSLLSPVKFITDEWRKEALLGIRLWLDNNIKERARRKKFALLCSHTSKTGNPSHNKKTSQAIPVAGYTDRRKMDRG